MADHSGMRLGAKPKKYDKRTLLFGDFLHRAKLPEPRAVVDYTDDVLSWPMYDNDTKGDCGIAGIAHMVQAWTAANGCMITPTLDDVLRVYSILSPDDDGVVLLDVLKYWRKNPICGVQIAGFVAVNPLDTVNAQLALDWAGGLYSGVSLPLTAQNQDVWDAGSDDNPMAAAGSWGGHCVPDLAYNVATSLRKCITWGAVKQMTDAFWEKYFSNAVGGEAYAIISPDWFGCGGTTPGGFDMAAFESALDSIAA